MLSNSKNPFREIIDEIEDKFLIEYDDEALNKPKDIVFLAGCIRTLAINLNFLISVLYAPDNSLEKFTDGN